MSAHKPTKNKPPLPPEDKKLENKASSRAVQPKEDPVVEIAKINRQGLIITVLITALLAPLALKYFEHKIDATPTIAITETFTHLPSETPTVTLEFSPTPGITETFTPSMTETFTPSPPNAPITPVDIMNVILIPTWYTGKAPLLVNFNVRGSFITFANGNTSSCISTRKACTFSWTVSREGQVIYGPEQGESVFPYRFEKKGKHRLFVYICHDQTCSSASADIEVK
jgi:hypothetical protein